jgi:flagellar assembly protein FliH
MGAPAKFMFNADFRRQRRQSGGSANRTGRTRGQARRSRGGGIPQRVCHCRSGGKCRRRRRNTASLESIATTTEALAKTLDEVEARLEAEAVEVAVAVGRKLATELVMREPMTEIANLATECFKQLVTTPHVVIRVNDSLHEFARDRINEIAQHRGFEGRLVVLAEPEIAPGDCRIEWADGGLNRDKAATDNVIAELVSRYLTARQPPTN